jgi:hypothetical protein
MSNYGDFDFVRAETAYRLERGRTAPYVADGVRALRRRVVRRRTPDAQVPRNGHAA